MLLTLNEEHEDGSATFNVTYNAKELESMIQFAVVRMIEEALTKMENEHFAEGGTNSED